MRRGFRSGAAVVSWVPAVALAVSGCGVRNLPAPQVPEKKVPQLAMPAEAPDQDEGQLIIDTTNGPATVQVTMLGMLSAPLCATTPCAANLPLGTFTLSFRGKKDLTLHSDEVVQVGRAPSILRHTMGSTRVSPGLQIGGILTLSLGLCLVGYGLLGISDSSWMSPGKAYASLAVGAGVSGAGVAMMYYGQPELTPGASVQWTPDGQTPPPRSTDKREVLRLTPGGVVISFR